MAEAELSAAAKIESARDHEAEARFAVAGAAAADSHYQMKGMGDRPLLYATVVSYHEAELRLAEALRLPALGGQHSLTVRREFDALHLSITQRFDKLASKASSIHNGAAELQSRLHVHQQMESERLRACIVDEAAALMGEWANDWEVAALRSHFGMTDTPNGVLGPEDAVENAMQTDQRSTQDAPGQSEEHQAKVHNTTGVLWHSTTSFSASARSFGCGRRPGSSVASGLSSTVASERFEARQAQLQFELRLAAAAQAAVTCSYDMADQHLGKAEHLLMAAVGDQDPVQVSARCHPSHTHGCFLAVRSESQRAVFGVRAGVLQSACGLTAMQC